MKILFTGGKTGGHFYPIIAVAEALNEEVRERKLLEPQLFYAASDPYDRELLLANNITFVPVAAGKIRNYVSILNFFDYFKTGWGIFRSVWRIFFLYPDVVFSTGGYMAFPTLLAARFFRIPVVILQCDVDPGRVNKWAAKFAQKIAVSFAEGAEFFPKNKVAHTGYPVRKEVLIPAREGAYEFLKLRHNLPIIVVTGGSQGSQTINDAILDALPQLIEKYQLIHQTGRANFKEVEGRARVVLTDSLIAERYKPFEYFNDVATRMAAGVATLIISRAGAGNIFEAATWGIPSILVPIPEPISHDQTINAFTYARHGGGVVIEQRNLTSGVLVSEIERIVSHPDILRTMQNAAKSFARPDAAKTIANVLLDIAVSHEQ
ncbi:MAG: UDP-N-acetylglucosamine--N-acetylmuramyl-(pentapeptide) pyrophosphoryl-undecaprenol N-acetylglucosamine transferase [Minisyncoccia bacterium]|jgi:UDP-N-acetylglucosamine--N-acetylmuramyl-(pentapeptide) pyrophosphoryl-undecaprenol N-acetylglucosamine transferase